MEVSMVTIYCADCHMPFTITKDLYDRLSQSHKSFYCPTGHAQSFTAQTAEERLRNRVRELEAAEQKRAADSAKAARLARKSKSKSKKVAPAKSG